MMLSLHLLPSQKIKEELDMLRTAWKMRVLEIHCAMPWACLPRESLQVASWLHLWCRPSCEEHLRHDPVALSWGCRTPACKHHHSCWTVSLASFGWCWWFGVTLQCRSTRKMPTRQSLQLPRYQWECWWSASLPAMWHVPPGRIPDPQHFLELRGSAKHNPALEPQGRMTYCTPASASRPTIGRSLCNDWTPNSRLRTFGITCLSWDHYSKDTHNLMSE